jgi:predicted acyl esterase
VGHRLRVEISSSAFGKIDLNLNTGGPVGRETDPVIAVQIVYHDRAHPSHLLLPVLMR